MAKFPFSFSWTRLIFYQKTDLISCTAGRFCIIYRVDNEKHTITEVSRFATDTDAQVKIMNFFVINGE